jgi:hypothetical protein
MIPTSHRLLLRLGLTALSLVSSVTMGKDQATGKVAVSYEISSPLTLHEPVLVEMRVENGLRQEIRFDLGHNERTKFLILVTQSDGKVIHVPRMSEEGAGISGKVSLKPGEAYSHRLILDEWYEFSQPGHYKVEISLVDPIQTEQGGKVDASTKSILSLEIEPRNPGVLIQRCAELADRVEQASSYAEAIEPALALSYVRDEAAVPYLARIIESHKLVDVIAIPGLGRIATDGAVDILIPLLQSKSEDVMILSGQALEKIERESSDPKLKEKIKRALSDPEFKERMKRILQG